MALLTNPALWPIAWIVFVDVLGFTVVIPLLPFYAQHMGATPVVVGALIATYADHWYGATARQNWCGPACRWRRWGTCAWDSPTVCRCWWSA